MQDNAALAEPNFSVSARTRLFIDDLNVELLKTKKDLEKFIPSVDLIDKYNISVQVDTYYISGFIKTKDTFTSKTLDDIDVGHGTSVGNLWTVQIPLKCLNKFFQIDGIDYFEISKKVTNK